MPGAATPIGSDLCATTRLACSRVQRPDQSDNEQRDASDDRQQIYAFVQTCLPVAPPDATVRQTRAEKRSVRRKKFEGVLSQAEQHPLGGKR